jgi:hypothetical protein
VAFCHDTIAAVADSIAVAVRLPFDPAMLLMMTGPLPRLNALSLVEALMLLKTTNGQKSGISGEGHSTIHSTLAPCEVTPGAGAIVTLVATPGMETGTPAVFPILTAARFPAPFALLAILAVRNPG